jgi:hypothetical protein
MLQITVDLAVKIKSDEPRAVAVTQAHLDRSQNFDSRHHRRQPARPFLAMTDLIQPSVRARVASHTSRCLSRRLRGSLPKPVSRKNAMPNTGMKKMARIQAIATDGLRLASSKPPPPARL